MPPQAIAQPLTRSRAGGKLSQVEGSGQVEQPTAEPLPKKRRTSLPEKYMNVAIVARWSPGIWLGRQWGSITHMTGTPTGEVREARAVRRKPKQERWAREAVSVIVDATWGSAVATPDEAPRVIPLRTQEEKEQAPPAADDHQAPAYTPKRVYVRQKDLERFGYTANCRRCRRMHVVFSGRGAAQIDTCRKRMEEALTRKRPQIGCG